MKTKIFLSFLCVIFPLLCSAHGPTPRKAVAEISIKASVDRVWSVIREFDKLAAWHPDLAASSGDGKNAPGSGRILKLKSGGVLEESLDDYNAGAHEFSYRLAKPDATAFPVSFYTATMEVKAGNGSEEAVVKWKSRFYRGDTGNFPPEGQNDEAAEKAMQQFFERGLAGLKRYLEQ